MNVYALVQLEGTCTSIAQLDLVTEIRTVNTGHATSEPKWKYRPILDTLIIDSKYWLFECTVWLRYSPWHLNNTCITRRMCTVNHAIVVFDSTHDDQYIAVTFPPAGVIRQLCYFVDRGRRSPSGLRWTLRIATARADRWRRRLGSVRR
jgi:hypothetical protein